MQDVQVVADRRREGKFRGFARRRGQIDGRAAVGAALQMRAERCAACDIALGGRLRGRTVPLDTLAETHRDRDKDHALDAVRADLEFEHTAITTVLAPCVEQQIPSVVNDGAAIVEFDAI
ncbi:hypothetical protein D9M72_578110 [compost metagenome]